MTGPTDVLPRTAICPWYMRFAPSSPAWSTRSTLSNRAFVVSDFLALIVALLMYVLVLAHIMQERLASREVIRMTVVLQINTNNPSYRSCNVTP